MVLAQGAGLRLALFRDAWCINIFLKLVMKYCANQSSFVWNGVDTCLSLIELDKVEDISSVFLHLDLSLEEHGQ